jgi:hypothetical protein
MPLLLYADDLVLLAPSVDALQTALLEMERIVRLWGMAVNHSKSVVLHLARDPTPTAQQSLEQQQEQQQQQTQTRGRLLRCDQQQAQIQQPPQSAVHQQGDVRQTAAPHVFHLEHGNVNAEPTATHLGVLLQANGGQDQELSRRMCRAGASFAQLQRSFFSQRGVRLATKMRLYNSIVLPQLLYGAPHTWALSQQQQHKLNTWHNHNLRRMMGLYLGPDTISIDRLHSQLRTSPISDIVQRKRLSWLGHVGRKPSDSLVKLCLAATEVPGFHRPRGAPPLSWVRGVQRELELDGVSSRWYQECRFQPDAWKRRS